MMDYRWGWSFSPQDHRRGKGGFEGEYFELKGITDSTFKTRDLAIGALPKEWKEIKRDTFQFKGQARYLVLFELIIE